MKFDLVKDNIIFLNIVADIQKSQHPIFLNQYAGRFGSQTDGFVTYV